MPSLEILLDPAPLLRERATPVMPEQFDKALVRLVQDMIKTCKTARGIGLAAPQVGVSKRIVVTMFGTPLVWVNPVLDTQFTSAIAIGPEMCLSLPGTVVDVPRQTAVLATYQDLHGQDVEELVTGPLAAVLQHEIDHLDGILITDYLPLKDESNDQTPPQ